MITSAQRIKLKAELKADVIANPSDWDAGFLASIDSLSDAWLVASHGDIGYKAPLFVDNTIDLNRAFA